MRLLYILGRNDSLHCYNGVQAQDSFCEYTSNRKITTLVPSLCFSFFPFVPIWILIYSSIIFLFFYFLLSFRAECWLQPPTDDCNLYSWGPLDPQTGEKKKLQAVNELPSFPSVKGVYKLDPFVRAFLCSLSCSPLASSCRHFLSSSLRPPLHHALPPALQFSLSTCLLHAPVAQWREQRCLALALSSIYCQRGSCLELAI